MKPKTQAPPRFDSSTFNAAFDPNWSGIDAALSAAPASAGPPPAIGDILCHDTSRGSRPYFIRRIDDFGLLISTAAGKEHLLRISASPRTREYQGPVALRIACDCPGGTRGLSPLPCKHSKAMAQLMVAVGTAVELAGTICDARPGIAPWSLAPQGTRS